MPKIDMSVYRDYFLCFPKAIVKTEICGCVYTSRRIFFTEKQRDKFICDILNKARLHNKAWEEEINE